MAQEIDRTRRVSELLRREVSRLVSRELNDPRLKHVTVNAVKVSKDLKHATVFVSDMGSDVPGETNGTADPQKTEKLLNNAAGFLRRMLSKDADLRVTPSLRFKYDDSIKRGVEMSSLIDSLTKK